MNTLTPTTEPATLKLRCKTLIAYCANLGTIEVTRLNPDDSIQRVRVYRDFSEHSQARFEHMLQRPCWHKDDTPMSHNEVDEWGEMASKDVRFYWYQTQVY